VATADAIADLVDLYAWHTSRETIVAIITFGRHLPGEAPPYDADVLYTLHLDNTADPRERSSYVIPLDNANDNASDLQVHVRFGQTRSGAWGFQVRGLPGARVETLERLVADGVADGGGGTKAVVGVFDNPFFFDAEGYAQTRLNLLTDDPELEAPEADFAFASVLSGAPVDGHAGTNVYAIVLEFSADAALQNNGDDFLQLWATSSRFVEAPAGSESSTGAN